MEVARLVRRLPAASLFVLAVALGLAPIALVASGWLPAGFDQLGALSASAAGLLLAALTGGRPSLRSLLRRALIWRVRPAWWVVVLLLPALPAVGARVLAGRLGGPPADLAALGSPLDLLGLLVFLVVFAGLGEEFGWRGFALPRLQSRHGALAASMIVGAFHALWHTPLFFLEGVSQFDIAQQAGFWPAFLGYSLLVLAMSVQFTWVFNSTGGSVLLVAVFHGSLNAWNGYVDFYRGQMAGVWLYTAVMVLASAVLVATLGAEHLSRSPRDRHMAEPDAGGPVPVAATDPGSGR